MCVQIDYVNTLIGNLPWSLNKAYFVASHFLISYTMESNDVTVLEVRS